MTYNVFGGTLNLAQSINHHPHRGAVTVHHEILLTNAWTIWSVYFYLL